jgi:hypothetical protein
MPVTTFDFKEKYRYQTGFNSHLQYVLRLRLCPLASR